MKAAVFSLGAILLLAGCGGGNEQQFVENGIRNQLAGSGEVTQISITKQGDGNYAGTATVRLAAGGEAHVNCTATRSQNGFTTGCAQRIEESLLNSLKASLRQSFTAQGLTVLDLELARQDDDHVTGQVHLRDASGAEVRYPCTGARQPSNEIAVQCRPTGGQAAPATAQEDGAAPGEGEGQAPAEDGQ